MNNLENIDFSKLEKFIFDKLNAELPKNLFYHSIQHTIDVYNGILQVEKLGIINKHDSILLKTASLFHDSGFIIQSKGHEQIGCNIAKETLPKFGFLKDDIEKICGMIMATKIPQTPKTKLEEIICDADLDYLGRNDFEKLSENLYKELDQNNPMTRDEWINLQILFLEEHTYFTDYARKQRNKKKAYHLKLLKENISKNPI